MAIINDDKIHELIGNYNGFCKAVSFREGEDFYSQENAVLELSYNENPLGPGTLALEALKRHAEYGYRYPPLAYSVLINALAGKLGLKPENLIITPGSVAAIYLAVQQYADPGDEVVFSKSSIPWYRWSTIGNNSIPVIVPLMKDMNHDLDAILKSIDDRTKIIIISNPHNPTGLYIAESRLKSFYEQLPQNILLIIDQAYYEYQTTQEELLMNMLNTAPNLMITRTFSKLHGLAGLRVGYGIANSKIIEALKARWLAFMPSISSAGAYAAYHALGDKEHYERSRRFNEETKQSIYALSEKHGLACLKSEANFVCVNIHDSGKNEIIFNDEGMKFTAGYFFGYPEWARISFIRDKSLLGSKLESVFTRMAG